jgi:hypothetical protein
MENKDAMNIIAVIRNPTTNKSTEQREALRMAWVALQQQEERENPKPLTLEQLKERVGKWIWKQSLTGHFNGWKRLEKYIADHPKDFHYGERWLAYDHPPKEAE